MDTLSHIVLGAAIGEVMLGKKIGRKGMLFGALANNFPDIDVLFSPFFHPVDALFIHRGITHSFLFVLLVSPLLGWLFSKKYTLPGENEKRSLWTWIFFFFVCILAHPILDSCTMYGTGLLEPFDNCRAQVTSLFIVEPLYTIPLVISFIVLLILKRESPKRRFWAKLGLYLSTIYLVVSLGNKLYVGNIFTNSLREQNIHFSKYITSPTPFNTILWNVFAKDTSGYWVGFYSHLDKTKDVRFSFIPRNDSLAGDMIQNEIVQKLIRFSNGFYCFTICEDELRFNDLRFAFSGEFTCDANRENFAFSFTLEKDESSPYGIKIKQNPWSRTRFYGFSNLVERIKGI